MLAHINKERMSRVLQQTVIQCHDESWKCEMWVEAGPVAYVLQVRCVAVGVVANQAKGFVYMGLSIGCQAPTHQFPNRVVLLQS